MKTQVLLHIDTTRIRESTVSLTVDGVTHTKHSIQNASKKQETLFLIATLLSDLGVRYQDITAISVATGPGSFTGLRVGVSIANTLGVLLSLPVNGKAALATPVYS